MNDRSPVGAVCQSVRVSETDFSRDDLLGQIRAAIDPDGQQSAFLDAFDAADRSQWLTLLFPQGATVVHEFRAHIDKYRRLQESTLEALTYLVPLGWAPFYMKTAAVEQAVDLARAGDAAAADKLLADQWDGEGSWRTKRVCDRVRGMGAGFRQDDYVQLFQQRARLLMKAHEHHGAGRYEASIPIIHAQMEGIVIDVTGGRKFFTSGPQKADLTDPSQLVSIAACLATLQGKYGESVRQTQAKGSLSRHGIAHGRELAYDTRINSAKSWSVLDSLVQWALPLAREEGRRRRTAQQAANAGRMDVNSNGRRVDDREFDETRDVLTMLGFSAIAWRRNRGRYPADLIGRVYTQKDFTKRGLPDPSGLKMEITQDGDIAWFWRQTISGWVLGYAVSEGERGMLEWFYSGEKSPAGPPDEALGWSDLFVRQGDWA